MLNLSSLLFCVSGIMNVSETVSPYDAFGYSLTLSGTIISILNFYPKIPHTTEWLLFIIELLYFFMNGHGNMVMHATPYPREMDTVTGCLFTTKGVL